MDGPFRRVRIDQSGTGNAAHLITPDGRYFVVRGRLLRTSNAALSEQDNARWVGKLIDGRRRVNAALRALDPIAEQLARAQVDEAKRALGERGPVAVRWCT